MIPIARCVWRGIMYRKGDVGIDKVPPKTTECLGRDLEGQDGNKAGRSKPHSLVMASDLWNFQRPHEADLGRDRRKKFGGNAKRSSARLKNANDEI